MVQLNVINFITIGLIAMTFAWVVGMAQKRGILPKFS